MFLRRSRRRSDAESIPVETVVSAEDDAREIYGDIVRRAFMDARRHDKGRDFVLVPITGSSNKFVACLERVLKEYPSGAYTIESNTSYHVTVKYHTYTKT
jgi:hypothetical protein